MNHADRISGKIDFKRVSPEQRTQLETFLNLPAVQTKLRGVLETVRGTIDVMSRRVRDCLTEDGIQVFDTIADEREQKRLLLERLRGRHGQFNKGHRTPRR